MTRPRLVLLVLLIAGGLTVALGWAGRGTDCDERGANASAGRGAGGCDDPNDLEIGSLPGNRDGTPGTLRQRP